MITVWLRDHRTDDKQDADASGMAAQSRVMLAFTCPPQLSQLNLSSLYPPQIKHFYLMRGENPAFYPLRVPRAQQELEYKQPQTHGREER